MPKNNNLLTREDLEELVNGLTEEPTIEKLNDLVSKLNKKYNFKEEISQVRTSQSIGVTTEEVVPLTSNLTAEGTSNNIPAENNQEPILQNIVPSSLAIDIPSLDLEIQKPQETPNNEQPTPKFVAPWMTPTNDTTPKTSDFGMTGNFEASTISESTPAFQPNNSIPVELLNFFPQEGIRNESVPNQIPITPNNQANQQTQTLFGTLENGTISRIS